MVEKLAAGDPSIGARDQDIDRAVADDPAPESSPELLQGIEPPVSLADGRGYGAAAALYVPAGWPGVLPLPPRSKVTPLPGYCGHDGDWPDDEHCAQWIAERPYDANQCIPYPRP